MFTNFREKAIKDLVQTQTKILRKGIWLDSFSSAISFVVFYSSSTTKWQVQSFPVNLSIEFMNNIDEIIDME